MVITHNWTRGKRKVRTSYMYFPVRLAVPMREKVKGEKICAHLYTHISCSQKSEVFC